MAYARNHSKMQGKEYNSVKEPCFMCLNSHLTLKTYEQLITEIEDLKSEIKYIKNSDSCTKLLKKFEIIPIFYEKIKLLEIKETVETYQKTLILYQEKVKFITLTFDPRKFKQLTNRQSQRNYLEYIINKIFPLGNMYGCFELHENGVVHSHFMINNLLEKEILEFRKYLTNYPNNIHACHIIEKDKMEAFNYINKPETKDKHSIYNFYKNI